LASLYDEPLRELENHPLGAVRRWAAKARNIFSRQIEAVHIEEAERDAN
jgi:hypothetical protein